MADTPGWALVRPTQGLHLQQVDDVVYEYLRNQIVRGIEPGTPLRLAEIAEALDVSTMPVRAALVRLEADGLVQKIPRRGTVVAPMSMEDLEEIQAVRFGIEAFAGRLGAEKLTEPAVKEMYVVLESIESIGDGRDAIEQTDAYLEAVRTLHAVCYEASGRSRLVHLIQVYEQAAERYIRLAMRADSEAVRSDTTQQRAFVAACESRDPERVEKTVRRSLQWTLDLCRPLLAPPKP